MFPDEPFILLDDNLTDTGRSLLFTGIERLIRVDARTTTTAGEFGDLRAQIRAALHAIEDAARLGLHAAGAFAYELAPYIDPAFQTFPAPPPGVPLLMFGLFRDRRTLSIAETDDWLNTRCDLSRNPAKPRIGGITLDLDERAYTAAIDRVQAHIADGDTYQANYTFRASFDVDGSLAALYQRLRATQPVAYGAFLNLPDLTVLSRSPELFFKKRGDRITVRPMKGTTARGANDEDDRRLREHLTSDPKSRAENVMIVDLMRNDLGRIALPGTVTVDALFEVEAYRSVNQMTSTITAQLPPETSLTALLSALFPCGSVTGAPKVRTMQIIRALETSPRGLYTGAIGHLSPDGDMAFNVPIRTISIPGWVPGSAAHRAPARATLGLGSGIVYDSDPVAEYQECLLKGRYLFDLADDDADNETVTPP